MWFWNPKSICCLSRCKKSICSRGIKHGSLRKKTCISQWILRYNLSYWKHDWRGWAPRISWHDHKWTNWYIFIERANAWNFHHCKKQIFKAWWSHVPNKSRLIYSSFHRPSNPWWITLQGWVLERYWLLWSWPYMSLSISSTLKALVTCDWYNYNW